MRAPKPTIDFAKRLRRQLTPPEVRLWKRLRVRLPDRPVFRRQYPLGPYVLDFYCPEASLCIEVDGWTHAPAEQQARDRRRDAWLLSQGVRTMRMAARIVMTDANEAADMILRVAASRCPRLAPISPPPFTGEGDHEAEGRMVEGV